MKEFLFDIRLYAAVRVSANSVDEAKKMLDDAFCCADANFGAWPNGDPILGEVSLDAQWMAQVMGHDPTLVEE